MEYGLRRVVIIVALLNLAYFGVEFAIALRIGSVSLLAIVSISSKMPQSTS